MGRLTGMIRDMLKRRGTKVSYLAIIKETEYDPTASIRSLVKTERSKIGKCSSVGTLSAVYDSEIGNFCSIARECYIGGASHPIDRVSSSCCFYMKDNFNGVCYHEADYDWHTSTTIGHDVWLGIRTIVLGGVKIGTGAVIGGGSVVTKDVGPYEIWAGNPARFIRKRFDDETIEYLLKSEWWNWSDEELKEHGHLFENPQKFVQFLKEKESR